MGRLKKSHNLDLGGFHHPMTTVWCFKCDNHKVQPGKKCQKCGARCLVSPPKKYKNRLWQIRLTEASIENGHIP